MLKFHGTEKLHGTCASIEYKEGEELQFQSRERILTVEEDNAGFMFSMLQKKDAVISLFEQIRKDLKEQDKQFYVANHTVCAYGEWCCGNIQKGVALSQIPEKMFVIFAIKIEYDYKSSDWLDMRSYKNIHSPENRIFNIFNFPSWEIDIDFNFPALSQNKLIELTEAVEKESPFGKAFGVSGIGEGIVWRCVSPGYESSEFWFKAKGEAHSISKVKVLVPIDVEKVKSVKEFVENVVTEQRLEQGISYLKEINKPVDQTSTGDFLRWIVGDVVKEEIDTMLASGKSRKKRTPRFQRRRESGIFLKYSDYKKKQGQRIFLCPCF